MHCPFLIEENTSRSIDSATPRFFVRLLNCKNGITYFYTGCQSLRVKKCDYLNVNKLSNKI